MIRSIQLIQSSGLKRSNKSAAAERAESHVLASTSGGRTLAELDGKKDVPSNAPVQLYGEAYAFVTDTLEHLKAGRSISFLRAHSIASRMVTQLESDTSLLRLALERDVPFSIQQHSVNVAIIAVRIVQRLGWPPDRVLQLLLAGFIHDAGSVRLPTALFSKSSSFTEEDRLKLVQRPLHSAELLSGQSGFEWLASIVSQIHEREDGSGYPLGLRASAICAEAKVLGVADAFEACMHRRPHRMGFTGPDTFHILTSDTEQFSEQITKALIRSFSVYPYNEYVRLNSGETGIVTEINSNNPVRPVVKLLYSADGSPLPEPRIMNLIQHSQLSIHSALNATALPQRSASASAGRD
jgi:HD-GYP domain-containing protein (c-di-GMP phosphodiesterase class II)